MAVKRKPLVLLIGFWMAVLVMGMIGSATSPSIALADGGSGNPLPGDGNDTTGTNDTNGADNPQEAEQSLVGTLVELFLILI